MGKTKIEWADRTWPVVTGCSPVSPGCWNCYAARMAGTRLKHHPRYAGLAIKEQLGEAPKWTGKINLNYDVLEQPLRWRKPTRIFVASMGDLFHEKVPDDFILKTWSVMWRSPKHQFLVLTKRAQRMHEWVVAHQENEPPLSNIWLGVTAENQKCWDYRVHYLRKTPAAVRFVSVEPLLGPIKTRSALHYRFPGPAMTSDNWPPIDLLIVGGESGPGARRMKEAWALDLQERCKGAGVAFFMKQMGSYWARYEEPWGDWSPTLAQAGDTKGAQMTYWPLELQLREMPHVP